MKLYIFLLQLRQNLRDDQGVLRILLLHKHLIRADEPMTVVIFRIAYIYVYLFLNALIWRTLTV